MPFGFIAIPQYATERMLPEELAAARRPRERGLRLTGSSRMPTASPPTWRATRRAEVRAGYLVGADGAHSTVRKGLGLTFEGGAFEEQYMLGDVEVDWSLPRGYGVRSTHQTDGATDDPLVCIPLPGRAGTGCRCSCPPNCRRAVGGHRARHRGVTGIPSCTTSRRCWTGSPPSRRRRATCDGRRCSGSATASSTPTAAAGCSSQATPRTSTRRPAPRA